MSIRKENITFMKYILLKLRFWKEFNYDSYKEKCSINFFPIKYLGEQKFMKYLIIQVILLVYLIV